ncbi:MAG: hypothetical protein A2138_11295 [Deltaproteobacteria bacterium RBG_16_71_12]|nr:MAG: hypothetical protein A2138_11295 [Deltaproteobacteria bacterium RBG_16_71_12]
MLARSCLAATLTSACLCAAAAARPGGEPTDPEIAQVAPAAPHHVADARLLAREMGLDPNKWFGHVEKAMLRLEDPKVARRMPHGYCRGSEPVKYVSDIQSRYDNWASVFPLAPEDVKRD